VNPSFPALNHELRFLLQHYPAAYDVDRTDGANPIRQPLANLSDAASLYGAIIYQKAPIVMRQLEGLVGATVFRDAVRAYVRTFAFAHASWPDFVAILDRSSPVDVASWNRAWISEAGRPILTTALDSRDGVITRLAFRQRDPRNRGLTWPQRLRIRMGRAGESRQFDVLLEGPETVVREAAGLPVPDWVLPDDDGVAYGLLELDGRTLTFLRSGLHTLESPMSRGVALVSLWELMLEGALPPADLLEELERALPLEHDELVLQHMLDAARTIVWRFTPADARPAAAAALEPILRTGLERATTTSARTAWFNALRSTALTGPTIEWLTAVWRRTAPIPGLPLAETDEADLALDLAVRDVPDAAAILREQLGRFANPDRRDRFAFILPAVSADDGERARFFEGLRDANRRKREAWVIDAMRYLHHPLRSAASGRLVVPALELTREIQQTGDIFFPKRWADAVLSGYQSPEMAARVRRTIDRLPADYPARLRSALLASADPLFRAARLLEPK
jgi:aminopeptidase N